jgi:predicted  nucleic acid-binding Zn-ribbon protein
MKVRRSSWPILVLLSEIDFHSHKIKIQTERRHPSVNEPNNLSLTDNQNEKIIDSLRIEIASLKSQMKKKDDRIASLDVMLNQIMESQNSEVRAYEDLESELEDLIDMLRKGVPHGDILDFLKVKDSDKLW